MEESNGEFRGKTMADIATLQSSVNRIELQVFNHIPTSIGKMDDKMTQQNKELNERLSSQITCIQSDLNKYKLSMQRWIIGVTVSLVITLIGVIANLLIALGNN